MTCEVKVELEKQYLAAVNLVARAQQRLAHAVTNTNIECAKTELRRVEEYRAAVAQEIVEHCNIHDCATQETENLCGQPVMAQKRAVA